MAAGGIVPSFDELKNGHTGFGLGLELAPVEQLAFKGGEEALTHRIVIGIAN